MADNVACPLLDKNIDVGYCLEVASAVEGILEKSALDDDITQITGYKEKCYACKYHK